MTARTLLDELRSELAPVEAAIRGHRYLDSFAAALPRSLERFTCEQYVILTSDRRSFAQLAARFPAGAAGGLFLLLAEGEGQALERLLVLAKELGLDRDRLSRHEPLPAAQVYPAYVAWLALNGSRTDVALAFLTNLAAWGDNCARMAKTLRGRHDTAFFDFFAEPAPGFALPLGPKSAFPYSVERTVSRAAALGAACAEAVNVTTATTTTTGTTTPSAFRKRSFMPFLLPLGIARGRRKLTDASPTSYRLGHGFGCNPFRRAPRTASGTRWSEQRDEEASDEEDSGRGAGCRTWPVGARRRRGRAGGAGLHRA